MGIRARLAAVLCCASMLSVACARAQDAQSAKAFLAGIYEKYQHGQKGIDFSGPDAGLYYQSSLVALLREDIDINGPENVPAVDYDPICGCQDWDGIWGLKIDVTAESAAKAEARVSFRLLGPNYNGRRFLKKLIVSLVAERGQWRIYDIVDESDQLQVFAMRKLLVDDIAVKRKEKTLAR
jgi:hypothetical protein